MSAEDIATDVQRIECVHRDARCEHPVAKVVHRVDDDVASPCVVGVIAVEHRQGCAVKPHDQIRWCRRRRGIDDIGAQFQIKATTPLDIDPRGVPQGVGVANNKDRFRDVGVAGVAVRIVQINGLCTTFGQTTTPGDVRPNEGGITAFIDEDGLTGPKIQNTPRDELIAPRSAAVDSTTKENHTRTRCISRQPCIRSQRIPQVHMGTRREDEHGADFIRVLSIGSGGWRFGTKTQ